MNGLVSWVCHQFSGDVLWEAHFLLSLSALRSLLRRASATDNYRQFKLGHSGPCLHATESAASAATAQLNFHHHVAKLQSVPKKCLRQLSCAARIQDSIEILVALHTATRLPEGIQFVRR